MVKRKPWYLRKRIMLPTGALLLAMFMGWYTIVGANDSKIMVYNESGETIRNIRMSACGQSFDISELADEESMRFDLEPTGDPGEATIAVLGTTNWNSSGNHMEPTGGFRIFFKLPPGGYLEVRSYRSWFQTAVLGKPDTGGTRRNF